MNIPLSLTPVFPLSRKYRGWFSPSCTPWGSIGIRWSTSVSDWCTFTADKWTKETYNYVCIIFDRI